MEKQSVVYIPPIHIHDYQQFRLYAKRARMVTYETEYHDLPFKDPDNVDSILRLKALKIYAIGVPIDGLPLTLVHTVQFPLPSDTAEDWPVRVEVASRQLASILRELETDLHAVQGNPSQPSIRELWMKTLR